MDVNISNNNINITFSETDEIIKCNVPKNKKLILCEDNTIKMIDKKCVACNGECYLSLKYEKTNYILKLAWNIEFLSNSENEEKIPSLWVYDNTNKQFIYNTPKTFTIIPKKCTQIKMIDPNNESIIEIEKLLN